MKFVHDRRGPVAVVMIDRPEKRNALTMDLVAELTEHVRSAAEDPEVAGLVLTGNGAFCAGADLRGVVAQGADAGNAIRDTIEEVPQQLIRALLDVPVPTVAALNGPAIGMGMDIALACDSRLLSPSGWMMQGWGRVGLIPGTGGELLLRRLNPSILWRLLEEQQPIHGPRAEAWGLGEAVEDEDAVESAVRRVRKFAELPRAALITYVQLYRAALKAELDAHLAACSRAQVELITDRGLASRVGQVVGAMT
jgi:enoyl-CoA hydratase/carnithine racemase